MKIYMHLKMETNYLAFRLTGFRNLLEEKESEDIINDWTDWINRAKTHCRPIRLLQFVCMANLLYFYA